jgi:hypothetical protein
MNEPDPLPPGRKYIWPWFAAGSVVLGIVLAVFWVWLEVRHVESERDVNGPLPSQH